MTPSLCRALFIIFQIVLALSDAYHDLSMISLDRNTSVKVVVDEVVTFEHHGPKPIYLADGEFGKGFIDLGGLVVTEAFYFKRIWATHIGGQNGVSFYEPTNIPPSYNLLGHFCKLNGVSTFTSVLIAKDTTGRPLHGSLKKPVNYDLMWTSKGLDIAQKDDVYIWLPIAPRGYRAVGHIVTTSPEKPSLDKVKCVRFDFTTFATLGELIWGYNNNSDTSRSINVYKTIPLTKDPYITKERSIPTGSFLARTYRLSALEFQCLKMVRSDPYSAMPNSAQIDSMIHAYAPIVYFHPDEEYFPSSVLWFFENGAVIRQKNYIPWPVINDGDNLPNNGSVDDAYLDLPHNKLRRDEVKKGYLKDAVAYIHVKPALGGIYTDLAIWLYYPFNGGGKFQLGPFTINLGQIGEHVSDWEHVTLRIDNFRGTLKAVYLSQHSKGKWLTANELEYSIDGTRPIVYSSLHGHTFYDSPTYHIHTAAKIDSSDIKMLYDEYFRLNYSRKSIPIVNGEKFIGFGSRDDTAKSDNMMDIVASYNVVYVDYKPAGVEPWLNYTGRWGPKITYEFTKAVMWATDGLPNSVKELAIKILHKFPAELLGEEGPEGPKMKDSWLGDERV
ncbi:hypothetical protein At1g04090-like [Rutidosis leptorrhynchoides]|uniref:hypothetical protein At1g04090-like n=1 Tax=Rutidosis leptorrhynchoides TaxID=125765 RepID=UPI003A9A50A1